MQGHKLTILPIVKQAMIVMWRRCPNKFHKMAISRILMMGCRAYGATALLFVQSTDGGKLMVPMTEMYE